MDEPITTRSKVALALLSLGLVALIGIGLADATTTQTLFVRTTYFFLMATVLCWAGTYLHAARDLQRPAVRAWVKDNWPGLVVALALTTVAALAIHPALRILSDEADLVGTSKNLFTSHSATFTVSGKNYYDSFWDVHVMVDRRPALFPFLVSLLHVVCGYSYRNAFLFNLLLLPVFLLVAYRLAKSLGGETFGIVAALLVAAHPATLIAVRSGGFDFLALFFSLLILKSLLDHVRQPSAGNLAILWMNLCMFAEVRYESALFIVPVLALLLAFRLIGWALLRPYAFVYALTPAYLAPRIWQAVLRGSVPPQDPGVAPLGLDHFLSNAREYFTPILSPFSVSAAHAGLVIALGLLGGLIWLRSRGRSLRDWKNPGTRFAIFVAAWMLLQMVVVFSYAWGRAQAPSAARLVIALDTFFSFLAAWALVRALNRWRPFVAVLAGAGVLALYLPAAAQQRMMNRLVQTRETATAWRFFDSLHEKRILIVTDRPDLFTIMDYGAMTFDSARQDPFLFQAWGRHLFYDIYVVQQLRLSSHAVLPGYEIWPDRKLETMLEYQNDADVLIRISRLAR